MGLEAEGRIGTAGLIWVMRHFDCFGQKPVSHFTPQVPFYDSWNNIPCYDYMKQPKSYGGETGKPRWQVNTRTPPCFPKYSYTCYHENCNKICFILLFLFVSKKYVTNYDNQWVLWTAVALTFACMIILVCCGDIRKKFPHNIIFLGIFTVCEGVLLGKL